MVAEMNFLEVVEQSKRDTMEEIDEDSAEDIDSDDEHRYVWKVLLWRTRSSFYLMFVVLPCPCMLPFGSSKVHVDQSAPSGPPANSKWTAQGPTFSPAAGKEYARQEPVGLRDLGAAVASAATYDERSRTSST